jgi:hypothetical protein
MKKSFFLLLATLLILLSSACNPFSTCKQSECGEYGDCRKGACECEPGWAKDVSGKCELEDLCYLKDCGPNGTCNNPNGNCDCNENYQVGPSGKCDKLWRESFIGTWYGSHVENGGNVGPYTMTISANSASINGIKIDNFGNRNCATFSAPLSIIGRADLATHALCQSSTCSAYEAGVELWLIDSENISMEASINHNGNGFIQLNGNFQRQ